MSSNWIQEAIKRPGALRNYLKRNRQRIKRLIKTDPLTKSGKIKVSALRKLLKLHKEGKVRLSDTIARRIRLAITLHRLRSRK